MSLPTQMIGGLISGMDTNNIIEQLMQIERRPLRMMEHRVQEHQTELEAYRGVNDLLRQFQSHVNRLASNDLWDMKQTSSTDESVLQATAGQLAKPGTHTFRVGGLAQTGQFMSTGFADRDESAVSPYASGEIRMDSAKSRVDLGTEVSELNGGAGIYHGKLKITDKSGGIAVVDLSTAATVKDVMNAINNADGVDVQVGLNTSGGATPEVLGDALVVTDVSGGAGTLKIEDYAGSSTATDLGIAGTDASTPGSITGTAIYTLGGQNTLSSLRGGLGINNGTLGTIRIRDKYTASVDGTTTLDTLQGGRGVNGGSPGAIVAFDGTTNHTIDLSGATTLNDVITSINNDTGGAVTASLGASNNLVLTAGSGTLSVFSDGVGNTTAEDLGIAEISDAGTITGEDLTYYDFDVDLSAATTVQGVLDAINHHEHNAGVTASASGRGFVLAGQGLGTLSVEDVGDDNTTAQDLGIAQSDASGTITGTALLADLNSVQVAALSGRVTFGPDTALALLNAGAGIPEGTFDITDKDGGTTTIDTTGMSTVQDVLDAINGDGAIGVRAYADQANGRIVLMDQTEGSGPLQVSSTASSAALGIDGDDSGSGGRIEGSRVLAEGINGARNDPTQTLGEIQISDDGGGTWQTVSLTDLTGADSLSDVLYRLNERAADLFGAGELAFRTNKTGNGIEVVNLSESADYTFDNATGTTATDLGLAGVSVHAGASVNAGDLDRNYISRSTALDDLNGGQGVYAGHITITDSMGRTGTVDLSKADTVGEVIDTINGGTLGISASINTTGDGILLTDTAAGGGQLRVEEAYGGSTAADLGLLGGGAAAVDGSFERVVEVDTNDTLSDVMYKLDDSGAAITSSVIYDGSSHNPYRLVVTSDRSGSAGDFVLDTNLESFGFAQNTRGQDSVLLYGQPGGSVSPVMLTSPTNTNSTAVLGLTLDMKRVSQDPITITVSEDSSQVGETMQGVVDSYNTITDLVAELDTFDEETNTPGILFGDAGVRNLMSSLSDLFFNTAKGVDGGLMTFYDIGVRFVTDKDDAGRQRSHLELDSADFSDQLRTDFKAVRDLLTMTVDVARKDLEAGVGSNTTADDDPNEPGSKFDLDNLINGNNLSSDFGVANGYQAAGTIASGENSVSVAFGQPRKLSRVILHHVNSSDLPASEYSLRDFKVEYQDAASGQWKTLRDVTNNQQAQTYLGFRVPTRVSQLRLTASRTNAADGKLRMVEIQAQEMEGLAGRMSEVLVDQTDGTNGFFASQQDRLTDQIDDLNESIEEMEARVEKTELMYLRKFAAMEQALAQMQAQSDFFFQQMDAWSNGMPSGSQR